MIREFFGYDTHSLGGFVVLGWFVMRELRAKLDAEKLKEVVTEEDARRARISGVVSIALDAALATLAIGSILFLAVKW